MSEQPAPTSSHYSYIERADAVLEDMGLGPDDSPADPVQLAIALALMSIAASLTDIADYMEANP